MLSSVLQFFGGLVLLAYFAGSALGITIVISPIALLICIAVGLFCASLVRLAMSALDPLVVIVVGTLLILIGFAYIAVRFVTMFL